MLGIVLILDLPVGIFHFAAHLGHSLINDFVLTGGPVIHGSAISEIESDLTNGTYAQVYDEAILENLQDDSINIELSKQKYTWRDF